jgi:hypothetical protein
MPLESAVDEDFLQVSCENQGDASPDASKTTPPHLSIPRNSVKKSIIAVASAILVTCAPAFAAAPVASADPQVVEATKQMLASMKLRDAMLASFQQIEQRVPAQMQASMSAAIKGNPKLTDEQKAEALKKLEASLPEAQARIHALLADPTLVDDMLAEMVPLYAETFTLDEIRQLSAFYATPVGQKMLAKMPELMGRSMEIGNRVMAPRLQKLMAQSAQGIVGQ